MKNRLSIEKWEKYQKKLKQIRIYVKNAQSNNNIVIKLTQTRVLSP